MDIAFIYPYEAWPGLFGRTNCRTRICLGVGTGTQAWLVSMARIQMMAFFLASEADSRK